MKLEGKIAVVTGASKGIGAGIAKALAAEGATVIVNYASSKSDADAVVAQIAEAGGCAFAVQADMSQADDVVRLFETIRIKYGTLDVLVNNAGVAVFQMIDDLTEDAFHKQFNVNVLGYLLAVREAVKLLGPTGSIINISSILSTDPYLASSVYSATKGAVDTLTLALARSWARVASGSTPSCQGIRTRRRLTEILPVNLVKSSSPELRWVASVSRKISHPWPCFWHRGIRTG